MGQMGGDHGRPFQSKQEPQAVSGRRMPPSLRGRALSGELRLAASRCSRISRLTLRESNVTHGDTDRAVHLAKT